MHVLDAPEYAELAAWVLIDEAGHADRPDHVPADADNNADYPAWTMKDAR